MTVVHLLAGFSTVQEPGQLYGGMPAFRLEGGALTGQNMQTIGGHLQVCILASSHDMLAVACLACANQACGCSKWAPSYGSWGRSSARAWPS